MAEWTLTGPDQQQASPWTLTGPDKQEQTQQPSFVDKVAEAFQLANEHPGFAVGQAIGKIVGIKNPESLGREGEALLGSLGPLGAEFAPLSAVGKLETSLRPPPKSPAMELPKVPNNSVVPTTPELKSMAQQAYKEAHDAGVAVKHTAYNNLVSNIVKDMQQEKINPKLHGDTTAAVSQLISHVVRRKAPDEMARLTGIVPKEPTRTFDLQELDTLRRVAGIAERGFDPQKADDRRLAGKVSDSIDEWLQNLKPSDVSAGDVQKASFAIKQARGLWSRMRKAEELDAIHEKALNKLGANYSNAGLQTAYKQLYRQLLDSKRSRFFSREEKAAMQMVVRGDKTERVLRYLGKFAPTSPLAFWLGGGSGYAAIGGLPGAALGAAVAGTGTAARALSNLKTQSNVDKVNALVRRGY